MIPGAPHPFFLKNYTNDAYLSSVVLLAHMEGSNGGTTFTDQIGNTIATNGTITTSTVSAKFGASSCLNNQAGGLSVASPITGLGSGDFTVECWVNRAGAFTGASAYIFEIINGGNILIFDVLKASSYNVRINNGGNLQSTTTLTIGTWYALALVRASSVLTLYINGVSEGGTMADSKNYSGAWYISSNNGGGAGLPFNGYIDELRITKAARYTANYTPIGPFVNP